MLYPSPFCWGTLDVGSKEKTQGSSLGHGVHFLGKVVGHVEALDVLPPFVGRDRGLGVGTGASAPETWSRL